MGSPPPPTPLTADEIARLMAAYQTERQDDQVALQIAFAITGAVLTYVLVACAYLLDHCNKAGRCDAGAPPALRYCIPLIAVAFVGFLILNVGGTRMRSVHLQRLEVLLAVRLPPPPGFPVGIQAPPPYSSPHLHTDSGLVYRPDFEPSANLAGKQRIRYVYAFITAISYGSIVIILIGFTVLALWFGPWNWMKATVAAAYTIIGIVYLIGMMAMVTHSTFKPYKI